MQSQLTVVVRGGRVVELCAPPPLGARILSARRGPRLVLVGTAASLVAGDRLSVRLDVGPGDHLSVRSVAAQVALPCPPGCSTALEIDIEVGVGGTLDWWPEPLVASAGARHRSSATLALAAGAVVRWVDELVLARDGEPEVVTTLRADLEGRPLLRDGLDTTLAGWSGPALAGVARCTAARYLGTAARLGSGPAGPRPTCDRPGWAALAGPGALARVVDADPLAGRAAMARTVGEGQAGLGWMGR